MRDEVVVVVVSWSLLQLFLHVLRITCGAPLILLVCVGTRIRPAVHVLICLSSTNHLHTQL